MVQLAPPLPEYSSRIVAPPAHGPRVIQCSVFTPRKVSLAVRFRMEMPEVPGESEASKVPPNAPRLRRLPLGAISSPIKLADVAESMAGLVTALVAKVELAVAVKGAPA